MTDVEKNSAQPSQLGKRERLPKKKPPTANKRKSEGSSFQVGDYVSVHIKSLEKYHIPCHVVQVVGKVCSFVAINGF